MVRLDNCILGNERLQRVGRVLSKKCDTCGLLEVENRMWSFVKKMNLNPAVPYWENKALEEMTPAEWESLCDGCAKCCLHKIEDMDSGQVYFTNVACRLLDITTCQCTDYDHRSEKVDDCFPLTAEMVRKINWLPESCAYRRLSEGRGLAWWHPLVSGNSRTVLQAEISVWGKVIPEENVDTSDLEDNVVDWFN